jgi:hypothetical protein
VSAPHPQRRRELETGLRDRGDSPRPILSTGPGEIVVRGDGGRFGRGSWLAFWRGRRPRRPSVVSARTRETPGVAVPRRSAAAESVRWSSNLNRNGH